MSDPKSCSTCEHRNGNKCQLSGFYMNTERMYPTVCGQDFRGWVPRLGLYQRLCLWWKGVQP